MTDSQFTRTMIALEELAQLHRELCPCKGNQDTPDICGCMIGIVYRLLRPYTCTACGREESACSADPCPAVIADREGL